MPWTPLPRIAFAIATYPFNPTTRDDLPLQLGDELYIIEQCSDGQWYRGYLVAPPSLLAGLTSTKGATLEARVFSGIFPASCVEIKEYLTTEVPLVEEDYEDDDEIMMNGDVGDDSFDGLSDFGDLPGEGIDGADMDRTVKAHRRRRQVMKVQSPRDPDRPRPAAPVPMLKVGDETPSCEGEPLVDEIASCLREWHAANLHELLLARQYPLIDDMCNLVQHLGVARRQLLHNVLTKSELVKTREKTVWDLVKGNKMLSREIIVRDPKSGRILTGEDSAVEITNLQAQMSLLDAPPQPQMDASTLHHMLLDVKAFVGISPDPTVVVFYLATKGNKPISESFHIELNPQGVPSDLTQLGKLRTLFVDLSTRDTAEDVFLIARVYNVHTVVPGAGPLQTNHSHSNSQNGQITSPTAKSPKEPKLSSRVSVLFSQRPGGKKDKNGSIENEKVISQKSSLASIQSESKSVKEKPSLASMPEREKTPPQNPNVRKIAYKKAVGVGVLDVGRFLRQEQGTEQTMRIFVPLGMGGGNQSVKMHGVDVVPQKGSTTSNGFTHDKRDHGEDWDRLIKDVIESNASRFEKSAKADRIHLYLRPFLALDAETLIRQNPTVLHNISCTPKIGFSGAPTRPRSDFYITIGAPHLPRHALMLHPRTGSVPLPPSSNFTQVQLTVEVRKSTGQLIKNCIIPYSNAPAVTTWKSTVVARDESWNETLRLRLEGEDISKLHVFISLASVAHAPVALAWFPLWDKNAFLKDGDHSLLFHKLDELTNTPLGAGSGQGGYLSLPWTAGEGEDGWAGALAMGGAAAGVQVQTFLCSTTFSQNETLLQLLSWRDAPNPVALVTVLKKVVFVPEIELVKLLRQVLDALFGLVVDHTGREDIEDLVFHALVTVLGIVYDRRFHLEPILDEYAEKHFNYPFATSPMLKSFTRLLSSAADPESAKRLRATFKVGKHIFRFIIIAREKQRLKEEALGIKDSSSVANFPRELHGVFKLLESLMRSNQPMHVGSQTLAVQHFHTWLPELTPMLSREKILLIAIDFLDSCAGVKGKLILYKLVLIINYTKSHLFSDMDSRRALTLNTVRWLEPHWGKTDEVNTQYKEQVRLCCSILSTQIEELSEEISEYIPKIVESYTRIQRTGPQERDAFSLLFPKSYPFPVKALNKNVVFDEALIELGAILAAISNIPVGLHLDLADDDLASFLMSLLSVHASILKGDAFPVSWLSTHIYHHKATLKTLETIAGLLVDQFLPDPDDAETFNTELWLMFFNTLLSLVGSDALALETFPEQKRRAVWKIAGDVREQGSDLLRRTWDAIGWETTQEERSQFGLEKMGGYQVQYVPGLVAPIVELCLSVHEGLRSVAVRVLQSMVVSEWTLSQDLGVVQAEMVDCLDRLFKSKRLTENISQKLFIYDLANLFEPLSMTPEDELYVCVRDLLTTTEEFLDLLVAVHNTPLGEAYHIMDTLRLMDFLKHMHKEDMYIRYVHQLVTVHLENEDYVEAALSLKLHADLYDWDMDTTIAAIQEPALPEQAAFERKEYLYLTMIKYFEDGKSWENALACYRELATQYETQIYDYAKLSKAQRAMAKIHENILEGERPSPSYYKVVYMGMGFPAGMRDKQFIVQGYHEETLQEFTDRIQAMHPNAKIISQREIQGVEGQFVHVTPVVPEHDLKHHVYQRTKVAPYTRQYLLTVHPKRFSELRPQEKESKSTETWVEKFVYITAEPFPTILRRSEIVSINSVLTSPFENAIETVTRKTLDLARLERQYTEGGDTLNIQPLTMAITKGLDQSGGGVFQYKAMLERQGSMEPPERVNALRTVILDYVVALKRCLAVHGRVCTETMGPVQENLLKHFENAFGAELLILQPPPAPPLYPTRYRPPTPTDDSLPVQPARPQLPPSNPPPSAISGPAMTTQTTARTRLSNMLFSSLYREKEKQEKAERDTLAVIADNKSAKSAPAAQGVIRSQSRSSNANGNAVPQGEGNPVPPRSRRSKSRLRSLKAHATDLHLPIPIPTHIPGLPRQTSGKTSMSAMRPPTGERLVGGDGEERDAVSELGVIGRPSTVRTEGSAGGGLMGGRMGSVRKRFSKLGLRGKD